jgi:hypothetical protein
MCILPATAPDSQPDGWPASKPAGRKAIVQASLSDSLLDSQRAVTPSRTSGLAHRTYHALSPFVEGGVKAVRLGIQGAGGAGTGPLPLG